MDERQSERAGHDAHVAAGTEHATQAAARLLLLRVLPAGTSCPAAAAASKHKRVQRVHGSGILFSSEHGLCAGLPGRGEAVPEDQARPGRAERRQALEGTHAARARVGTGEKAGVRLPAALASAAGTVAQELRWHYRGGGGLRSPCPAAAWKRLRPTIVWFRVPT